MMNFEWTDQSLARVEALLCKKYSAREIAADIGDISTASVISKIHRTPHLKDIWSGRKIGRKIHRTVFEAALTTVQPVVDMAEYEATRKNLTCLQIGRRQCRWATNDAAIGEDHLFCGHDTSEGSSWCDHHRLIAYGRGTESERSATRMAIHLGRAA